MTSLAVLLRIAALAASQCVGQELQREIVMTVGGRRGVDEIRLRHWQHAAERCGYPAARIVAHVKELTAKLPDLAAAARTAARKAGLRHPVLDQLVDQIADNAKRIAKRG